MHTIYPEDYPDKPKQAQRKAIIIVLLCFIALCSIVGALLCMNRLTYVRQIEVLNDKYLKHLQFDRTMDSLKMLDTLYVEVRMENKKPTRLPIPMYDHEPGDKVLVFTKGDWTGIMVYPNRIDIDSVLTYDGTGSLPVMHYTKLEN